MRISVVIVTWNGWTVLEPCLRAVQQQRQAPDEIIVVENGSTDGSAEMIRTHFPKVRLITLTQNVGFARGNNVGIRAAQGDYIALLNNDTEPEPSWLDELCRAMRDYPKAGICASKVITYDAPARLDSAGDQFWTVGEAAKRGRAELDTGQYAQPEWVFGASAAATLYQRALLTAIGGFDERFSPAYHEDTDLNFQAQLRGYPCRYVPQAVVRHRVSATLGKQSQRLLYLRARNMLYVLVKNLPSRFWRRDGIRIVTYHLLLGGYYLCAGRGLAYVAGLFVAFGSMPSLLRARRAIQRQRVVSDAALERLLTPMSLRGAVHILWEARHASAQ